MPGTMHSIHYLHITTHHLPSGPPQSGQNIKHSNDDFADDESMALQVLYATEVVTGAFRRLFTVTNLAWGPDGEIWEENTDPVTFTEYYAVDLSCNNYLKSAPPAYDYLPNSLVVETPHVSRCDDEQSFPVL